MSLTGKKLTDILRNIVVTGVCCFLGSTAGANPDLPNPSPTPQVIPSGSLIIPMDNDKQNLGGLDFNLTAYGLATHLLHGGVPLKWAITAGKAKDGIDFNAESRQLYPSAGATAFRDFRGGPFIVHRDFVGLATPIITSFANSVVVHELTQDATVDVRYELLNKPKVAVFDDGGKADVHGDVLLEAGFVENVHYEVISAATLATINADACFTFGSEPHWNENPDDPLVDTAAEAIRQFVNGGGNFLAQCAAIETYENNSAFGLFKSTDGIEVDNTGNELFDYANPDLSYSQFEGALDAGGGSVNDWVLLPPAPPNVWRGATQFHAQNIPAPQQIAASATKLTAGTGSLVYYLGTHSFGDKSIEEINGRRMYLNAVMTPSGRPTSCNLAIIIADISGTVYEELNGDSLLGDSIGAPGVNVRIYADVNDNGVVDAGDSFFSEQTTDASGNYSFTVSTDASGARFLVAVDSKSVAPAAALNGGFTQANVWAEQTYGDDPATLALDVSSRFGGRTAGVSDSFNSADTGPAANSYQHVGRADVIAGDVTGLDFAFSFNVQTNVRDGDDDGGAARSVQGSLRQFVQNANALSGANALRFVPAVAANSGSWWTVALTGTLPAIADGDTTIDGRAYDFADGISVVDTNLGTSGNTEVAGRDVGAGPDGREGTGDEPQLPNYFRPELEIDVNDQGIGFEFAGNNGTIARVAIFNLLGGDDAVLFSGGGSGGLATENFIGLRADGSDPDLSLAGTRVEGGGIYVDTGAANVINNFIGFTGDAAIQVANTSLVEGNEVYRAGLESENDDGITLEGSNGQTITVRENRVFAANAYGIESWQAGGPFTIEDNSVIDSGQLDIATGEIGGIRVFGNGSVVRRNVIKGSQGAGLVVSYGTNLAAPSQQNRISRNVIYNNGGLGIDLDQLNTSGNPNGDGVSVNDGATIAADQNAGFDFPVLLEGRVTATDLVLDGFARPGAVIELFIAGVDASNFGEGQAYLITITEGGSGAGGNDPVADSDAGTGSYTNPVNGLNQGADASANRFRFTIPLATLPGVAAGTVLTATGRDGANNTSEFSGNLTLVEEFPPVANDDSAGTELDTPVAIDVLVNDTDANGDALTIIASDSPTANGGSTAVNDNGTPGDSADDYIDYTPPPGFSGADTFTYTISDGRGGTDTATVTVSMSAFSISGTVYNDSNDNGLLDPGEQGVGNQAWIKLIDAGTGSVIDAVQGDFSEPGYTGNFSFDGLTSGDYEIIVDDNDDPLDDIATPPLNWNFRNPGPAGYPVAVTVAGADVSGQELGLTFDLSSACACGLGDGLMTQTSITIDGDMTDWASVLSDLDNNACDEVGAGDRDAPVQSTGRDMIRTTVTWTASRFYMFTARAASTNNTQNYIYYGDTNNNGFMENGETVLVAKWSGNTGTVVFERYTYIAVDAVNGDPMVDGSGFSDGYTIPGYLNFVETLPAADAVGSTSGPSNGVQMEWAIDWAKLGASPETAIRWHTSSTNSNSFEIPNLPNQIDDNMGGCGGRCSGSNQYASITPTPINVVAGDPTYLVHQFTNSGNGTDVFDLTSSSVGDWSPASYTYYRDLGTVGAFDPADVLLTDTNGNSVPDTGTLAPFEVFDLLVAVALPPSPAVGDATVTTTAESNFQRECGALPSQPSGSIDNDLNIPGADIAVAKTDGLVSAVPGQTITYTITITNAGPDSGTGIQVSDTFDPSVFDVASVSWTCSIAGVGTCADSGPTAGNISTTVDLDSSAVATFSVTAPTLTDATGTVLNTATATVINERDPDSGNNTGTDNDTVLAPTSDLSLSKSVDNPTPQAGETIVFTLTLNNGGPSAATGVEVTDQLPAGYTYQSDDGGGSYAPATGVWTVGDLAAPGSAGLNITVTVNAVGPYENVAEVTASDSADPDATPGNGDPAEDDYASNTPAVNRSPVANDDTASTATDSSIAVDVLSNDTDADGDPLTITASDSPTANGGTTVINDGGTPADPSDDTIDYTPAAGFAGSDTFTYTISDGNGGSDTATVTVTVNNAAPVANDDSASTNTDTSVNIDVLANDTDANSDPLTITASDSPTANGGTTVINDGGTPADPSDDTIDYTPAPGFAGSDTFTYTIDDGNGGSDTATVTITVNNAGPVANDDVASTNTDTAVNIDVLANDTDDNNDPLTITASDSPTANGGTTVINDGGTPADPSDDTIDYTPAAGFAGSDTFTYTIDDGNGGSDTATVTVTVDNAPPVANDDGTTTPTDTAVNIDVLANDTDANNDPLTITASDSPTANGGTTVINDGGTPADPSDDTIDYTPAAGFAGNDTFTYTISDGNGGSDTATVTVTVNNAPPVANDDGTTTPSDTAVNIDVLANDTDANNDPLTITASDSPTANGGTTVINDGGTPADPSDDTIDYTPAAGFAGSDTFTYTIDDGNGGSDTATVTIGVNNAAPVANDDAASTDTNTAVNIDVLANDTDANSDPLTITASDSPTANGGTTVINDGGTPADPSDDTIDYTPAAGFAGSDTFTYTISDGNGGSDTATVTVTVNNAVPVANDDSASTNTDTAVNIDVLANDTDANNDPLTITASDSPTANGGTTVINDGGTPGDPSDDTIDYTPAAGFAGSDTFTYTISDGNGGSDSATVTVTVNNAGPVANDDVASTNTDTAVNIDVLANDTDANNDPLTISASDSPTANGGATVINDGGTPADPSDDTIDYTPAAGFAGSDTFTYTISDGNGGSDTATVTVTVNNAAPVANNDSASTNTNTPVSVDVLANDVDANSDPLTITASDSPTANGGATVINDGGTPADPSDDTIDYTPAAAFKGSDTFTYTIEDGEGGSDTATVTVTVNNAVPLANDDAASTNTDTAVNIDVLVNDNDANNDPLTITAADDPSANGGKVTILDNGTPADPSDDLIEYKPAAGFAGVDTFTYTISDGDGGSDTATVTVTVNNAAPVANDDAASTNTNTAVNIDVLANDADANGDPLTITASDSLTANGGTTVINDGGTPADPADDTIDYAPAAGFAGSVTFTYTISDGNGGSDTATVTVTVNNAVPVANDDSASTNTDTAVNIDV
ncbi:MAG: tandem-95 repeat protein, partial [Gammaproteobacteria bacterium]|nr:tandem-95 repeat protein [Gammaproteobacteria bacterium]